MSQEELTNYMTSDGKVMPKKVATTVTRQSMVAPPMRKGNQKEKESDEGSVTTIYQKAVEQIAHPGQTEIIDKVDAFISQVRRNSNGGKNNSSSEEEFMDTGYECETGVLPMEIENETERLHKVNNHSCFIAVGESNGGSRNKRDEHPMMVPNALEQAEQIIVDAEKAKARLYDLKGKAFNNSAFYDENYQMIDSHVEETLKKKIIIFEYVDFGKLLSKKGSREDDNRMEIVNKNGMMFLSPVADRDNMRVSNYSRWEQAFRVYSNVLTTRFPHKSPELLQYNHTIHTAAMSYHWENVYSYDKEFRHHIARYPARSWSIILQQAWTMLLKDRLKNDNSYFQKGNFAGKQNKRDKEPCRRFNRGRCSFGLSCKFDHRCSVPKCGKFGHGAHVCRLRDSATSAQTTPVVQEVSGNSAQKN